MISAASHHFRLPAMAFKITSCTFIIHSISADETFCSGFTAFEVPSASSGQNHVLIAPDNSHANNTETFYDFYDSPRLTPAILTYILP
jgi:hypothetical protein